MTQYELDNIDFRADMEIYRLLCCAVIKCRIEGKAPSHDLLMRRRRAKSAFEKALPPDKVYRVLCEVEADGNGRPLVGGHIECSIMIIGRDELRRGRLPDTEEEEDDEDDEF